MKISTPIIVVIVVVIVVGVVAAVLLMGGEGAPGAPAVEEYGVVTGSVTDTAGTALGGVSVSVSGQTTTTNEQGWFSISNVLENERALVTFSKTGYVATQRIAKVVVGENSYADATLSQAGTAQSLDATAGGTVTYGGGSIEIENNSLVDSAGNPFTGTAQVALTPFDPSIETQREAFPGNFAGLVDGTETPFESFGFMDVSVTGSGELQLASGKTSTIEIPIPTASVATAPDNIDLWYYDTSDGYWKQEGIATKVENVYRGTITHFSYWNADCLFEQAYLTGKVVEQREPSDWYETLISQVVSGTITAVVTRIEFREWSIEHVLSHEQKKGKTPGEGFYYWAMRFGDDDSKIGDLVRRISDKMPDPFTYGQPNTDAFFMKIDEVSGSELEMIADIYSITTEAVPKSPEEQKKLRTFEEVLASGEGMCRDQALLLSTALKRKGIDSDPVYGDDHAWVRVTLSEGEYTGKVIDLDPTWYKDFAPLPVRGRP